MIPKSKTIMTPYLILLSDQKEWSFQDIIEALGKQFKVSNDERMQMIPSGQKVFDYRVGYSRTIFKKVRFIESTRKGFARITQEGIDFIANPHDLNEIIKSSRLTDKPIKHK